MQIILLHSLAIELINYSSQSLIYKITSGNILLTSLARSRGIITRIVQHLKGLDAAATVTSYPWDIRNIAGN